MSGNIVMDKLETGAPMRVGNEFAVTSLIQCAPRMIQDSMHIVEEMLSYSSEVPGVSGVTSFDGPYITLGQHDLFLQIYGTRVDAMMRSFYAMIDTLLGFSDLYVRDFVKTIGFTWLDPAADDIVQELPPVAHMFVKYRLPLESSAHHDSLIVDRIRQVTRRWIQEHQPSIECRLFGHFSWHETSVAVYGGSYSDACKIRDEILSIRQVWDVTVIPFLVEANDGACSGLSSGHSAAYPVYLETLLKGDYSRIHTPTGDGKVRIQAVNTLGPFGRRVRYKCSSAAEAVSVLRALSCDPYVQGVASMVEAGRVDPRGLRPDAKHKQAELPPRPKYADVASSLGKRIDHLCAHRTIVARKFEATKTQISVVRSSAQYRYVVPKVLEEAIDLLLKEDIDEEVLEFYFREIRQSLQQRLAGSGLGGNCGNAVGIFERFGGYQEFALACESLLIRCYRYFVMARFETDLDKVGSPIFLVSFDYGLHYWTGTPSEVYKVGIQHNLPIVVRLPLVKYRPYLWINGLRELANWIFCLYQASSVEDKLFLDRETNRALERFADTLVCSFISKKHYARLLGEQLGLWEPAGKNRARMDCVVFRELQNRLDGISARSWMKFGISEGRSEREIVDKAEHYRRAMCDGRLILDVMSASDFVCFLNAYYGLERAIQASPKAFSSFIASLYWMHPEVTRGEGREEFQKS